MRRILVVTLAAAPLMLYVSAAQAANLNVTLEADRCDASIITVGPACEILYRVKAELSYGPGDGLALVVLDLEFDGGPLPQANEPTELPMRNFAAPNGFSANPEGYGGTPQGSRLIQVGGAQNIFNHGQWSCEDDDDCPGPSTCDTGLCTTIPGLPTGTLITGVAAPGSPVVLATGALTAPSLEGTYTLRVTKLTANLVKQGATGDLVWLTEAAGVGFLRNLSITVQDGTPCCGEVFEACCRTDGSCTMVTADDCLGNLGGIPGGLNSTCEGDTDNDGVDGTCGDECPGDATKLLPGGCGCGFPDGDSDGDAIPDCIDQCPGWDDLGDLDENGIPDCLDPAVIPTLSQWGLVILTLLFLVGAKLHRHPGLQCAP
ncbi:MAG: IPTL-CTERM sorting domain-containing protein [Planctomycetota bacterium]|jgi:hypothetical protein